MSFGAVNSGERRPIRSFAVTSPPNLSGDDQDYFAPAVTSALNDALVGIPELNVSTSPEFDSISGDPRFGDMLKRLGIPRQ